MSGVELCFTGTLNWVWSPHSLHPDFLRRVFCRVEHTWSKWELKEREVARSELSEALKEKGEEQWLTPSSFFLLCVFIVKVVAFNLPAGRIQSGSPMAQSLRKSSGNGRLGGSRILRTLEKGKSLPTQGSVSLLCSKNVSRTSRIRWPSFPWWDPGHQARLDCLWDFPNQMTNP